MALQKNTKKKKRTGLVRRSGVLSSMRKNTERLTGRGKDIADHDLFRFMCSVQE